MANNNIKKIEIRNNKWEKVASKLRIYSNFVMKQQFSIGCNIPA